MCHSAMSIKQHAEKKVEVEGNKGNYLSCIVYLAEFNDFLAEHLRRYRNKGTGSTSYLSHIISD